MTNPEVLLLGLDGGGTKTAAQLARLAPSGQLSPIATGYGGPCNPRSTSISQAAAEIDRAVAEVFARAGRRQVPAAAACLSVAGGDRSDMQSLFLECHAVRRLADRVQVTNDAEAVLACLPAGRGFALIAGTGSFVLGRNASGVSAKVGGWGFRCGDEGSGYALATAGLAAATRYADGRGETTRLLPAMIDHFGVTEPRQLIERLYAPGTSRRSVADAAPVVLRAAADGDRIALKIMDSAAADLSEMLLAARRQLGQSGDQLPLALAGGVITHSTTLRQLVLNKLAAAGWDAEVTIVSDPVVGAVELARQQVFRP